MGPGQSASFSVVASGTGNLIYNWQRDGRNITGAVLPTYILPDVKASDNGARFNVLVSNAFGQTSSTSATLSVAVNNPPVPTIATPASGSKYIAGQTISFSGGASDPQDGTLSPDSLTWQVDLHDSSGVHSILPPTSGIASGTFTTSQAVDTSTSVYYRIILTAVDSDGLQKSTHLDVTPQTANLSLSSQPAGFTFVLDGRPQAGVGSVPGVSGTIHTLQAPGGGILGGVIYQFSGWSDGDTAATRQLVFPSSDTSLSAVYQAVGIVPYVTVQASTSPRAARECEQPHAQFQRSTRRILRPEPDGLLAGAARKGPRLRDSRRPTLPVPLRGLFVRCPYRDADPRGPHHASADLSGHCRGLGLEGDGEGFLRPADRR